MGMNRIRTILKNLKILIIEMTGLSELTWLETGETPPCAIYVQNNLKTLIPLEGLIDPANEVSRLKKTIVEIRKREIYDFWKTRK